MSLGVDMKLVPSGTLTCPLKLVLVPVAVIGCGKTTTALTLQGALRDHVGVVINDEVPQGRKSNQLFVQRCLDMLASENKSIVVLDRNNHLRRERERIFRDFEELNTGSHKLGNVKFVCLDFLGGKSPRSKDIWGITTERVSRRGDNHQSIKAISDGEQYVKKIMGGFVSRFQRVDVKREPDHFFDLVIRLSVTSDSHSSLQNAIEIYRKVKEKYPEVELPQCDDEQWRRSFQQALDFKPTFSKNMKKRKVPGEETNGSSRSKSTKRDIIQMLRTRKERHG